MAEPATSQIGIVNAALARIGSTDRLTSIDADSNSAKRAKAAWRDLRRALLIRHPFNFALARRPLNEDASPPAFGWRARFALPEDCVRWLPPARGERGYFEGESEGGFILTNARGPLPCRYIRDVEEVPSWSPGFVMAMTVALAEWINMGVTESVGMGDRLQQIADEAIRIAKRVDGLETGARQRGNVVIRSDWLTARNRPNFGRFR